MTAGLPVRNMEYLAPLYGAELPVLDRVRVRSVQLNWRGPDLTLRLDLPDAPLPLPQEWAEAGVDAVQCHLVFLGVEDLSLSDWDPPVTARLSVSPPDAKHRIKVVAETPENGIFLEFSSFSDVLARHLSGFRRRPDGTDSGPHLFKGGTDSRLYATVPEPHVRIFHER
ncbi:Imm50 family immunity protein [Streptomyces sp. NPDC054863]